MSTGDNERAKRYLEENLSVLQELEEEEDAATTIKKYHAYNLLGILALNEDGDPARATALWKESLALARETGDTLRIGMTLCSLGYAAVLQGDNERATALCEETLAFAREHGMRARRSSPKPLSTWVLRPWVRASTSGPSLPWTKPWP